MGATLLSCSTPRVPQLKRSNALCLPSVHNTRFKTPRKLCVLTTLDIAEFWLKFT
eukprot:m.57740 g.57740  ORF g.57740 m.57740 type:complete len:55 (-) comp15617_c0_seq4:742-906(-)